MTAEIFACFGGFQPEIFGSSLAILPSERYKLFFTLLVKNLVTGLIQMTMLDQCRWNLKVCTGS